MAGAPVLVPLLRSTTEVEAMWKLPPAGLTHSCQGLMENSLPVPPKLDMSPKSS
jgi:hypothetical protein